MQTFKVFDIETLDGTVDAAVKTAERLARSSLDERVGTEGLHRLDAGNPADRMISLCDEVRLDFLRLRLQLTREVRDNGERCIVDGDLIELCGELLSGRLHERRMERCGDRQHDGLLGPSCLELLYGLLHAMRRAGDDRLARAVEVDRLDFARLFRRLLAGCGNRLVIEADDGCHAALAYGDGLLHVLTALVDECDGILKREDARCDKGRILAEAMAASDIRLHAVLLEDLIDDDADRQDGGLRVGRELEIVCRALEAHVLDGVS